MLGYLSRRSDGFAGWGGCVGCGPPSERSSPAPGTPAGNFWFHRTPDLQIKGMLLRLKALLVCRRNWNRDIISNLLDGGMPGRRWGNDFNLWPPNLMRSRIKVFVAAVAIQNNPARSRSINPTNHPNWPTEPTDKSFSLTRRPTQTRYWSNLKYKSVTHSCTPVLMTSFVGSQKHLF